MANSRRQAQPSLFQDPSPQPEAQPPRAVAFLRSGAFVDNMKLPVHRWFRYSAGFSADWVRAMVRQSGLSAPAILDPFAGSGTTLLAAQSLGLSATGIEAHPFVARVARAKLAWSLVSPDGIRRFGTEVSDLARTMPAEAEDEAALLRKCFPPDALAGLSALRRAWRTLADASPLSEVVWLALTSIIRECSPVGTAQWQYVLPNKSKAGFKDPFVAFRDRVEMFAADVDAVHSLWNGPARLVDGDSRQAGGVDGPFDLVVTSPPYPNNYDYADATRLEMTFWGEVSGWGDLHGTVRNRLICSCSQHSQADRLSLPDLLRDPAVAAISGELGVVCDELAVIRQTKGGKKTYHTMIAAYFIGLSQTLKALRPMVAEGGVMHFMIGDSAPYGVHVPVERWLGQLAVTAGFRSWTFEKMRDRNTKWKNRKHDVPLHEGVLTIRG
jgi:hypothetical protein